MLVFMRLALPVSRRGQYFSIAHWSKLLDSLNLSGQHTGKEGTLTCFRRYVYLCSAHAPLGNAGALNGMYCTAYVLHCICTALNFLGLQCMTLYRIISATAVPDSTPVPDNATAIPETATAVPDNASCSRLCVGTRATARLMAGS